ncbi:hypothetical protein GGF44_003248, partial [Coemansia sp. RSA 1694]
PQLRTTSTRAAAAAANTRWCPIQPAPMAALTAAALVDTGAAAQLILARPSLPLSKSTETLALLLPTSTPARLSLPRLSPLRLNLPRLSLPLSKSMEILLQPLLTSTPAASSPRRATFTADSS